ncbi:MAG: sugar nucleotide-binding protein, partial [Thermoguttaceae bacterium]
VPHLARAILFLLGQPQDKLPTCQDAGSETGRLTACPTTAPFGVYHVTDTGQTTWCEFATEIFRLAAMPTIVHPISSAEYGAPTPRPAYSVLDTSAYHRLGGPAMPDWKTGLADYFCERRSL